MDKRFCECGCGGEITPKRNHKYVQARFLAGHNTRLDNANGRVRHSYTPKPEEIPSGICECGCGKPTDLAQVTIIKKRHFLGHPLPLRRNHHIPKRGKESHKWKGGRIRNYGYILLFMPDDPRANSKGYVPEHRVIWEQANGRSLRNDEDVHHVNGQRDDNRPENLIALTKAEHAREHNLAEDKVRFMLEARSIPYKK